MSDNIHVAVRIRPLIEREIRNSCPVSWIVPSLSQIHQVDKRGHPVQGSSFTFDRVFPSTSTNKEVYQDVCRLITESVVDGFHGTIFAYGQTSSGKTFTMMGEDHDPGVIKQAVKDIFLMQKQRPNRDFLFRVSYMELYNEKILDLISNRSNLAIKENLEGQVFVGDLEEVLVRSVEDVFLVMDKGEKNRHFGDTAMNEHSSRSHTIFKMVIESKVHGSGDDSPVNVSHLNLVDLAGSEKAGQMGTTGSRFKEGVHINKSLLTLSQVISKLSEGAFVNYRDSKLTRILQNSLGGNSRTAIICTVTPTSVEQTQSTLNFAVRAKHIQNQPVVNEVLSEAAKIQKHLRQIASLQKQMQQQETLIAELQNKQISTGLAFCCSTSTDNNNKRSSRRETWCGKVMETAGPFSKSQFSFNPLGNFPETETVSALQPIVEDEEFSPSERSFKDQTCEEFSRRIETIADTRSQFITTRRGRKVACSSDTDIFDAKTSFLDFSNDAIFQTSPGKEELKEEIQSLKQKLINQDETIRGLQDEYQELQEYTIIERQINLDGTVLGEGPSFVFLTPKQTVSRILKYSFCCQTDITNMNELECSATDPQDAGVTAPNETNIPSINHIINSIDTSVIIEEHEKNRNSLQICCTCEAKALVKRGELCLIDSAVQTENEGVSVYHVETQIDDQYVEKDYHSPIQAQNLIQEISAVQTNAEVPCGNISQFIHLNQVFTANVESNHQTIEECETQTEQLRENCSEVNNSCQTTILNLDCSCQTEKLLIPTVDEETQTEGLIESTNEFVPTERMLLNADVQTEVVIVLNQTVQTQARYFSTATVQTDIILSSDAITQYDKLPNAIVQTDQVEFSDANTQHETLLDTMVQTDYICISNGVTQTEYKTMPTAIVQTEDADFSNAVTQTEHRILPSVMIQAEHTVSSNMETQTSFQNSDGTVEPKCSVSSNAEAHKTDQLNAIVQTERLELVSVLLQTSCDSLHSSSLSSKNMVGVSPCLGVDGVIQDFCNRSCQTIVTPDTEKMHNSLTSEDLEEEISYWKEQCEIHQRWAKNLEQKHYEEIRKVKEETASQISSLREQVDEKQEESNLISSLNAKISSLRERLDEKQEESNLISSLNSKVSELEASLQARCHDNVVQKRNFIGLQQSLKDIEKRNQALQEKVKFYQSKADDASHKLRRIENANMDNTVVHFRSRETKAEMMPATLAKASDEPTYPGLGFAGRIRILHLEKELSEVKKKYNKLLQAFRNSVSSSSSASSIDRTDSKENLRIDDERLQTSETSRQETQTPSSTSQNTCVAATPASSTSVQPANKMATHSWLPETKARLINIKTPKVEKTPQVSPPARTCVPVNDDFALDMSDIFQSKGSYRPKQQIESPDGCKQQ